jgi:hypothetical protein
MEEPGAPSEASRARGPRACERGGDDMCLRGGLRPLFIEGSSNSKFKKTDMECSKIFKFNICLTGGDNDRQDLNLQIFYQTQQFPTACPQE